MDWFDGLGATRDDPATPIREMHGEARSSGSARRLCASLQWSEASTNSVEAALIEPISSRAGNGLLVRHYSVSAAVFATVAGGYAKTCTKMTTEAAWIIKPPACRYICNSVICAGL